ncbi:MULTISPECIES: HNH endonuclease signature motif containing protein [Mycobacteriaceae]|uniref:DUF222 domain-containing protein n=1 Tax=Mycolicibacterium mucogenicum DSM 44124 TaxID=1226753 RepID=A0A8H2JBF1_MYCMU|nr:MULTISPECIES: HNH endonuclease signature motif containing protein [Mycobacteriaceae]KAB7757960.1 hypothetical protein MMUC44124_12230 [Mycolicibacterium mucogenicum DSM 44124]QPG71392.1 DUF222 domain-containing protein [Mycolicibacterium mucogenicum DSM 44124]SDZ97882.1 protein of unknown function [Mycobacterium sp. 283mftsu]
MGIGTATLVEEVYDDLDSALVRAAALDYSTLSVPELLALQSHREQMRCAAEAVDHAVVAALQAQTTANEIGAKNWADVLRARDRLSSEEARRRVRHAELLGPRRSLTGEVLPPLRPHVADAVAAGVINGDHVDVIESFFVKLPAWAGLAAVDEAECALVAAARHLTPEGLRSVVKRKLYELDQDGPEPDDRDPDPDRERGIVVGKQRPDGSSELRGRLTPTARAVYEALMVKYAAPGMCNPADEHPCTCGTPTQEQIDNDHRTLAQRHHDAWETMGRLLLSIDLGEHNGFPVTIVATCTLEQLEDRAGVADTHTGSPLPVKDLVNLAARAGASCYLTVFDNHGDVPLYLGRARRTATTGQRLALFARDKGCTRPDCTRPAADCQAHHAVADWRDGGQTNITDLTLACGPDNRLATDGGWTTTMKNGRAHWTPPPLLDIGQPRTNHYHHPTLYPAEGEGGDGESDSPAT